MRDDDGPQLPAWSWAFVAFRIADGATHALLLLAVIVTYGKPIWVVAATSALLNMVSVPASFAWAKAMDGGRGRRRLAVAGFTVAAGTLVVLAMQPPFPVYLAVAALFTGFGVASGPAASTLVLEGVPRAAWSRATGALSRRTSLGYLTGMAVVVAWGLAGGMDIRIVFLVAAAVAAMAALVAVWTVPPFTGPAALPRRYDADAMRSQGRFERIVFAPFRMIYRPTLPGMRRALAGPSGAVLAAVTTMFAGSLLFFASYPGVLIERLGLVAGMALVAQSPSHLGTLLTYPLAGRLGDRIGWDRAFAAGALLRVLAVPGMVVAVLFYDRLGLAALLLLHAAVGISFAFLQVNGPCLSASLHPDRRGQGVGAYHAALAMGTLLGSAAAFPLLLWLPLQFSYVAAIVCTAGGAMMALAAVRRLRASPAP